MAEMSACARCDALHRADACRCPHCGTVLRTCTRPHVPAAALLLGLSLTGGAFCTPQPKYGIPDSFDSAADSAGDDTGAAASEAAISHEAAVEPTPKAASRSSCCASRCSTSPVSSP